MDINQASTADSKRASSTRTSQKKKSESKKRQSTTGASPQNPKPAKQRKVEDQAKTNSPLAPKKTKDNIVNNISDSKKQPRKKGKCVAPQSAIENNKETLDDKTDNSPSSQEESEKTAALTSTSKSGSEVSRSKRRRIRKRRLLESLGIAPPPAATILTEKASKKKKKRKKKKATSSTVDNNLSEHTTNVKSSKKLDINVSNSAKKAIVVPEKKKKDLVIGKNEESSGRVKEVAQETLTKAKSLIFENRAFKDSQLNPKQKEIKSEDNNVAKVCSNCDELQELDNKDTPISESRSPIEEVSDLVDKKEDISPPLKTDLVNFLSHNNVEGLFRSALLNDVTLSSRCSEKEVKNFFNTYGTFSERGRTQFAAVEKLLSNNNSNEEISSSSFFESSTDKGAQNLTPAVPENKDILESKPGSSLLEANKYEYFSVKHLKDTLNSEEPQNSISSDNSETEVSSCRRDSLGNCVVLTGGFSHGPIYTSPNFQNRVTSSANSNQIQGSGSRVFLPNVYGFSESKTTESSFCSYKTSCREQEKPETKSVCETKHYNQDNNFSEAKELDSATELNSDFSESHQKNTSEDNSEHKEGTEVTLNITCPETVNCNTYVEVTQPLEKISNDNSAPGLKNQIEVSSAPTNNLDAPVAKIAVEKVSKATGKGKETCEKGSKVGKGKSEGTKTVEKSTAEITEKDTAEIGEKEGKTPQKNKEFLPKATETASKVTAKVVKESEKETNKNSTQGNIKITETSKSIEKDKRIPEKLQKCSKKDLEVSEKEVDGSEKDTEAVEKYLKSHKELKNVEGAKSVLKTLVNAEIPVKNSKKETDVEDHTVPKVQKSVEVPEEVKSEETAEKIGERSTETNVEIFKTTLNDKEELQRVITSEEGAIKGTEQQTETAASEKDSTEVHDAQKDDDSVALTEKYIQSFKKVLEDTEKELEALDIQSRKQITRSTREEVERLQKAVQGVKRDRSHIESDRDTFSIETVEKESENIETNKESIDSILENIERDINSAEKRVSAQEAVIDKDQTETVIDSCEIDNTSITGDISVVVSETVCVAETTKHLEAVSEYLETKEAVTMDTSQEKVGKKQEKSREEVIREREAKKAAKAMKKAGKVTDAAKTPVSSVTKSGNDQEPASKLDPPTNVKPKEAEAVKAKINKMPNKTTEKEGTQDKSVEKENEIPAAKGKSEITTDAAAAAQPSPQVQKEGVGDVPGKSKAELRAERRAKQEAQRAAKAAQQSNKQQLKPTAEPQKPAAKDTPEDIKLKKISKALVPTVKPKVLQHKVKLFNHLYPERTPSLVTEDLMLNSSELHPAVVRLGVQYASRIVVGSNARCIALLSALKQLIQDYETPPQKEFSRGLEASLQSCVTFLEKCRPLSVSMTNALRHLKWHLTQLPNNVTDSEAKKKLQDAIDTYIRDQIEVAAQAICIMVQHKIADGDVILVYSCSSLVQRILIEAHNSGTKFRVIVVDGRPWREGREMLRRLVSCGLKCTYVLVSAASFIMREVTKVLLGAHALLANGYVMSRAGASQIALVAHAYNVPVLVCCETHKFCERVQTDSFVYNELGNPDDLVSIDSCSEELPLSKWRSIGSLTPLNLTYDVTPPDLVTAVVTELAILPCTSVPVILRIKPTETGC